MAKLIFCILYTFLDIFCKMHNLNILGHDNSSKFSFFREYYLIPNYQKHDKFV
jgi:hypothetical protein